MKTSHAILLVALSVGLSLGLQKYVVAPQETSPAPVKETAYDRIMRTGTLQCAYAIYPPFLSKDVDTGKLSGIAPAIMAEFEKASGIKVEWGPEIDWGNIAVTLQTNKADAFCAGMYMTPKRGRVIAGSVPLFFGTLEAFVRQNDTRFDGNPDLVNRPDVRIAANMGDISEEFAQSFFPNAQRVYKSEMGGESQLFMDVAANKADLTLSGPSNLSAYNQGNPAMALRKVEMGRPLMAFPSVIGVDIRDVSFLPVINATLIHLTNGGVTERILRTYTGVDYGHGYIAAQPQTN